MCVYITGFLLIWLEEIPGSIGNSLFDINDVKRVKRAEGTISGHILNQCTVRYKPYLCRGHPSEPTGKLPI